MHNTKEKILAVATKIFSRYGFYKTSMDEIAPLWRAFATRATTFKNPECFGKGTSLIRVCNPNVSDKATLNQIAMLTGSGLQILTSKGSGYGTRNIRAPVGGMI